MSNYFTKYKCELGEITIFYNDIGIYNVNLPYEVNNFSNLTYKKNIEIERYFESFFNGKETSMPKLDIKPTGFQKKVFDVLINTKKGTVLTYGDVAELIGCNSPRAIGQALKKNPVPIIIPCHRVVGKGWAGGFGGQIDGVNMRFKEYLLSIEKEIRLSN